MYHLTALELILNDPVWPGFMVIVLTSFKSASGQETEAKGTESRVPTSSTRPPSIETRHGARRAYQCHGSNAAPTLKKP